MSYFTGELPEKVERGTSRMLKNVTTNKKTDKCVESDDNAYQKMHSHNDDALLGKPWDEQKLQQCQYANRRRDLK